MPDGLQDIIEHPLILFLPGPPGFSLPTQLAEMAESVAYPFKGPGVDSLGTVGLTLRPAQGLIQPASQSGPPDDHGYQRQNNDPR